MWKITSIYRNLVVANKFCQFLGPSLYGGPTVWWSTRRFICPKRFWANNNFFNDHACSVKKAIYRIIWDAFQCLSEESSIFFRLLMYYSLLQVNSGELRLICSPWNNLEIEKERRKKIRRPVKYANFELAVASCTYIFDNNWYILVSVSLSVHIKCPQVHNTDQQNCNHYFFMSNVQLMQLLFSEQTLILSPCRRIVSETSPSNAVSNEEVELA